jgi:hypothetical protein
MPSVHLTFTPPARAGFTKLYILEGPSVNGPFNQIETVTPIGAFPDYIREYSTDQALNVYDWFAIQWEDSKGVQTDVSSAVRGGSTTLVGQVVQRMLLRDPTLDEIIAQQEAEAAVADYYNVTDPYTISAEGVSPMILSGLTNLALVRSYLTRVITSSTAGSSWTAGIVAMKDSTGGTQSLDSLKALLDMANRDLGKSLSLKFLMAEIEVAGGFKQIVAVDLSRTIVEIA